MKIHILVLNYNGAALLERNLHSFAEAMKRSAHDCRLSVVDNASQDESLKIFERFRSDRVGWIAMNQNRILCAYNEVAEKLGDDILVLMNNDIEADKDFIDALVEPFLKEASVFFVTPKCFSGDKKRYEGNKTKGRIRYGVYWSSAIYPGHESEMNQPGPTLQGGFGAFDRKKFLMLGGYDDLYLPGRLEDADICFRAYKRGWKCLYAPQSVVYHEGGVSFHKAFGVKKTLVINWRNTFLFMWKNFSDPAIFLAFLFWLPARLAYSLLSGKPEFFLGFVSALPRLGQALGRKKRLEKEGWLRSVPDSVILNKV